SFGGQESRTLRTLGPAEAGHYVPPYFAGAAGVCAGAGAGVCAGVVPAGGAGSGARAGADTGAARPPITELGPRWPMIPSISANTMNSTAHTVVALDSTVAPARAPNAA